MPNSILNMNWLLIFYGDVYIYILQMLIMLKGSQAQHICMRDGDKISMYMYV